MPTKMENGWEKDTIDETVRKLVEGHAYWECGDDKQESLAEVLAAVMRAANELKLDFDLAWGEAECLVLGI